MSTVMIAFKAKNTEEFEKLIFPCLKTLADSLVYVFDDIEAQIFETKFGVIYRIIEEGYGLKNKMWEDGRFESCICDTRTDTEYEETQKNIPIAKVVDRMIREKQYKIRMIRKKSRR